MRAGCHRVGGGGGAGRGLNHTAEGSCHRWRRRHGNTRVECGARVASNFQFDPTHIETQPAVNWDRRRGGSHRTF